MMVSSDIVGILFVYGYVGFLIFLTEKILARYPSVSRKILHIMVGNIVFILPIFQTREAMVFGAAAPFIVLTFLISPRSPIKSKSLVSKAGHGLGLVYYAISWTVLAYLFFEHLWVVGVGILAMSYGDGFASIFGVRFGRHAFQILRDKKSLEGSLAMFSVTLPMLLVNAVFYSLPITLRLATVLVLICFVATVIEMITPRGLDNLTVPLIAAALCWYLVVI
ncbi:MAG: diacylglycerol/polyprenol kinase family protein [Candidatus Hadarchaeum sp.]|uniref:diacylglycerol/polyprenol kinase family protein n=1 Tax=Candidatus Hadarchaeum sp. TaxID=2883567 RepID=UPI003D0CB625